MITQVTHDNRTNKILKFWQSGLGFLKKTSFRKFPQPSNHVSNQTSIQTTHTDNVYDLVKDLHFKMRSYLSIPLRLTLHLQKQPSSISHLKNHPRTSFQPNPTHFKTLFTSYLLIHFVHWFSYLQPTSVSCNCLHDLTDCFIRIPDLHIVDLLSLVMQYHHHFDRCLYFPY